MNRIACPLLLIAAWSGACPGQVPTYSTFELQARSNLCANPNEGTHNLPCNWSINSSTAVLNDSGQVAIKVLGGDGTQGIWFGQGGSGVIKYNSPFDAGVSDPSINNAGLVVFPQSFSAQNGIYQYNSVTDQSGLFTTQPLGASSWGSVEVNDVGEVGYRAGFGSGQAFSSRGANPTQALHAVEAALDPISPYSFLFSCTFNNNRQIASVVRLGAAGETANSRPDQLRVFNADESSTLIAEDRDSSITSPYTGFDSTRPGLTDDGRVSFVATLFGGGRGVFLSDGSTTITIANTNSTPDLTVVESFPSSVNEAGLVAFRGKDGMGDDAIYVGDGTTLRKVVKEHDIVPTDNGPGRIDQHDNSLVFGGAVAINAAGDITFQAALAPPGDPGVEWGNGLFIAYADPIEVPGDIAPPGGDGAVNVQDLLAVISAWGTCPKQPASCFADVAPAPGDGVVNVIDLLFVISNWG